MGRLARVFRKSSSQPMVLEQGQDGFRETEYVVVSGYPTIHHMPDAVGRTLADDHRFPGSQVVQEFDGKSIGRNPGTKGHITFSQTISHDLKGSRSGKMNPVTKAHSLHLAQEKSWWRVGHYLQVATRMMPGHLSKTFQNKTEVLVIIKVSCI